jgi:hypothetical protein
MIRPALIIAALAISTPAVTEPDSQSARAFQQEQAGYLSPVTLAMDRRHAAREPNRGRPVSQLAEANYQIAVRAGNRIGVPESYTRFVVAKESGGNAAARNPASTATGLGQFIRGTHAAIIGRPLTLAEHVSLASVPEHNAALTAAHLRACLDAMPGASPAALWRNCHYYGLANVGGSIDRARSHYASIASDMRFTPGNAAPSYRAGGQS